MTSTKRLTIAAAALLLLWAGFAYQASKPAGVGDYRRTLVQVAQSAHDAAATGALLGRQQLAGQVFAPFAATAYDDVSTALSGAARKLAGQPPPDDATAGMRDRLASLVQDAVRGLGDAATTDDDVVRRAAVDRLEHVSDQLNALLTSWGAA